MGQPPPLQAQPWPPASSGPLFTQPRGRQGSTHRLPPLPHALLWGAKTPSSLCPGGVHPAEALGRKKQRLNLGTRKGITQTGVHPWHWGGSADPGSRSPLRGRELEQALLWGRACGPLGQGLPQASLLACARPAARCGRQQRKVTRAARQGDTLPWPPLGWPPGHLPSSLPPAAQDRGACVEAAQALRACCPPCAALAASPGGSPRVLGGLLLW